MLAEIYETIQKKLIEKFQDKVFNFTESYNTLHFEADKNFNLKVLSFLKEDPELNFSFLNDLCGVHQPNEKNQELWVVYHLRNLQNGAIVALTIKTSESDPKVFTATQLFSAANWMERETYDFFGIEFSGHPNLIRILNVPEMNYFPLRKQYPLEERTRKDKDDNMFGR